MLPVYIHGFNSAAGSRSGKLLEKMLPTLFKPQLDYALRYAKCLDELESQIMNVAKGRKILLMGSSLGAFYALQLRLPNIIKVLGWNPVIYPAMQLARWTGQNQRFTDGVAWLFSKEALLSYASAPDAREWRNFAFPEAGCLPERVIFLARNDELLDSKLAQAYWQGHARLVAIEGGHSVANYEHARAYF